MIQHIGLVVVGLSYLPSSTHIISYVDPHTTHHVFTLLGPLLALLGTMAAMIVTAALFFRCRLIAWFREASRLKLAIFLVVVSGLIAYVLAVYKLLSHFQTNA